MRKGLLKMQKFDDNALEWHFEEEYRCKIEREQLAEGSFRVVFKGVIDAEPFKNKEMVFKKYKQSSIVTMQTYGDDEQKSVRKAVQIHALAKNITVNFWAELKNRNILRYSSRLVYGDCFFCHISGRRVF